RLANHWHQFPNSNSQLPRRSFWELGGWELVVGPFRHAPLYAESCARMPPIRVGHPLIRGVPSMQRSIALVGLLAAVMAIDAAPVLAQPPATVESLSQRLAALEAQNAALRDELTAIRK